MNNVITRRALIAALESYSTAYPEEQRFASDFLALLNHPRAYERDHYPGHVTGSAWIIDTSSKFILLTHHAKLNKWLQPGGHADGDENILQVALREATEETGLKNLQVLGPGIFDIDIHTIPQRKDVPEHLHYDVRFLVQADRHENLVITEESHDLRWISLSELAAFTIDNQSLIRMGDKVRLL